MKYATYCDFGTPNRKETIRIHLSEGSAKKAFRELEKIYGRDNSKVWQEPYDHPIVLKNGFKAQAK
jgi:hypothetical protein